MAVIDSHSQTCYACVKAHMRLHALVTWTPRRKLVLMAGEAWTYALTDYNGEVSTTTIRTGAITAASIAGTLTDIAAMVTAIDNMTLGVRKSDSLRAFKTPGSNALASDPNAQVERKWLVTYDDITPFFDPPLNAIPNAGFGAVFNLEIGTADADLLADNQEFLALDAGPGLAFVTAFQTLGRTPYGGDPRVLSIELVGRTR